MDCRKFLQFEFVGPARLVYNGESLGAKPHENNTAPSAPAPNPIAEPSAAAQERGAKTAAAVEISAQDAATSGEAAEEIVADMEAGKAETVTAPDVGASTAPGAVGDDEPIDNSEISAAFGKVLDLLEDKWTEDRLSDKDKFPTPKEVADLSVAGKIDNREMLIWREIHKKKLLETGTLPRTSDEEIIAFKKLVGIKLEKEEEEESSSLVGIGAFGAIVKVLQKLMKKLGLLADQFTSWIKVQFGGDEKTSPAEVYNRSPIEQNKEFTVTDGTNGGVDLKADGQNLPVTALPNGEGAVVEKTANSITIKNGDETIVYRNLTVADGLVVGTKVQAGTRLGTINGDILNLKYLDGDDNEIPHDKVTARLSKFTKAAVAVAVAKPTEAEEAEAKAKAPPAAEAPPPGKKATTEKVKAPIDLDRQLATEIDRRLAEASSAGEIDVTKNNFTFELPYKSGDRIATAQCVIGGDTLKIGDVKYHIELPLGVELKTVKITGTTLEQSLATLTASLAEETIPARELLKSLNDMRAGPSEYKIKRATFTKIT